MKTLADYGIEQRAGQYKALCPKCSHTRRNSKEKCLSVDFDEGIWLCHHCGWAGSVKTRRREYPRPQIQPYTDNDILSAWFQARAIPKDVVKRARIALEGDKILFPYLRKGECVNIKYRGLHDKTFYQFKDAEKVLYGLDSLVGLGCTTWNSSDWAIICEGEIDVLSCQVAGFIPVLSVPDGAPPPGSKLSDLKFEYLANCADGLEPLTKIIIATDGDEPGQYLAVELVRRLGPERCWKVHWPEGCKDANDVLISQGADALKALVDHATPYPIDGIVCAEDLRDEVFSLYREGSQRGLSTGLRTLDELYTIRPGEMTVVTGIPSHGKSSVVDFIIYVLAEQHGWTTAVFSPENFPLQRHAAKLMSLFCGRPFSAGKTERMTETHVDVALRWLHSSVVFISPPEEDVSIDSILALAKKTVLRHGIRGLVIDPWNELDHTRPSGMTETEYISQALTKIRRFSRLHGLHVWVVAHPTKLKKLDNGTYPVPTPYDISGSGHWRNKADNCIAVWRNLDDAGTDVVVHVQKIRFREVGQIGRVTVKWEPINGRYYD